MTQLKFADAIRVAPSPNRGMANLELLDGRRATIAAGQLDASAAVVLVHDLLKTLGVELTVVDDELRDLLAAAYGQGAHDVHTNYQPELDPDFTEAACDYAASVICDLSRNSPEAAPGETA